jgi:hypothetical protein
MDESVDISDFLSQINLISLTPRPEINRTTEQSTFKKKCIVRTKGEHHTIMTWNQLFVSTSQGIQGHFGWRPVNGTIDLPKENGPRSFTAPSIDPHPVSPAREAKLSSWMKPVENENELLWMLEAG